MSAGCGGIGRRDGCRRSAAAQHQQGGSPPTVSLRPPPVPGVTANRLAGLPNRLAGQQPGLAQRQPPAGTGGVTVTRAVLVRSRYFSRLVAHKVITASEADKETNPASPR